MELNILLVEDDQIDVMAFKRALKALESPPKLWRARDGAEGLAMLRGEPPHARIPRPMAVVLDLNLPGVSGFDFLEQMRADPALADTVVFVLTTSKARHDVEHAHQFKVDSYTIKTDASEDLQQLIRMIELYVTSMVPLED